MGYVLDSLKGSGKTTEEITTLIDLWIFSAQDRRILKYVFVHGLTYEETAEKVNLSADTVKRRAKKGAQQLLLHI